jgi:hypothetical protein
MGLQLLQLLAAVRSPGATNKHDHRRFGAKYIDESNFLAFIGLQREWRCHISDP